MQRSQLIDTFEPLRNVFHYRPRYEGGLPRRDGSAIDYREDFFGKPAFLTVSGQLQVRTERSRVLGWKQLRQGGPLGTSVAYHVAATDLLACQPSCNTASGIRAAGEAQLSHRGCAHTSEQCCRHGRAAAVLLVRSCYDHASTCVPCRWRTLRARSATCTPSAPPSGRRTPTPRATWPSSG